MTDAAKLDIGAVRSLRVDVLTETGWFDNVRFLADIAAARSLKGGHPLRSRPKCFPLELPLSLSPKTSVAGRSDRRIVTKPRQFDDIGEAAPQLDLCVTTALHTDAYIPEYRSDSGRAWERTEVFRLSRRSGGVRLLHSAA